MLTNSIQVTLWLSATNPQCKDFYFIIRRSTGSLYHEIAQCPCLCVSVAVAAFASCFFSLTLSSCWLMTNDQMINYYWSCHISSSLYDHLSKRSHVSSTALQCALNKAEIKSDSLTLQSKIYGPSRKYPHYPESFQAIRKISRLSGKYPDHP